MNTKRSFLENLNKGRQRRPGDALEEINRTLDQLQYRLERALQPHEPDPASGTDLAKGADIATKDTRDWMSGETEADLSHGRAPAHDPFDRPDHTPEKHARDLSAIQERMQAAVKAGLRAEFTELRNELRQLIASAPYSDLADGLKEELERLSDVIIRLAERSDDKSIKLLRLELDQLRTSFTKLAREDTIRALDQRWGALEDRLSQPDPLVERLAARLEEISNAVDSLPESLSLSSMEERLRSLAVSLDQFVGHQTSANLHAAVEDRLDEISRAITASASIAQTPAFDIATLERIEARISSLAAQLEEVVQDRPGGMIVERLNALSERVDEIAARLEVPERLASCIAQISERLETISTAGESDHVYRGLEERFTRFLDLVERFQVSAIEEGRGFFRNFEQRLEQISERLDAKGEADALHSLEMRLQNISDQLHDRPLGGSSIDPEIFRDLEAQIARLTAQLSRNEAESQDLQGLAPRLDRIESTIGEHRDLVLEAARQAASEAVENLASAAPGDVADDTLKGEIQRLYALTLDADERNSNTFEAIHDTLLKIVDHLSAGKDEAHEEMTDKLVVDEAPSLDPSANEAEKRQLAPQPRRTPSQAAAAAAEAASQDDPLDGDTTAGRKVLSQFSRAFSGFRAENGQTLGHAEPALRGDEAQRIEPILDPELANEPLDPGSGAPDLYAIMRRVRGHQEEPGREDEAARADFIAAARRAAQAAAAEAEILKNPDEPSGGQKRKQGLDDLLGRNKRKLLAALCAGIVIFSGFLLARTMLQDGEEARVAALPPSLAQEALEDGEADAATLPSALETASVEETAESDETAAIDPLEEPVLVPLDAEEPSEMTTGALTLAPGFEEDGSEAVTLSSLLMPEIPDEIGPDALREAAEEGNAVALFEIGNRYAEGRGVEMDLAKAFQWYELAAEKGIAPAQYRIANQYEKGAGVDRNIDKAKMWYQLAAEQGNASAMHNLGVLYAMGADGEADHETAARWFRRAGELGVTDSQFNLGILFAKGAGVIRDLSEAYKWFEIAARNGDVDAAQKRDEIAATLAPADLADAQSRARSWQPRELSPEANMVNIPENWASDPVTTGAVDIRKAITNVQLILNKNGFDAGPADGVLGERTRAAIRAFQKAKNMPETGEIDDALVRELLREETNGAA